VGDTVDKPSSLDGVRHRLRRRKQLEKDLEHVTQEMYRRNRELADTNRALSLLQTIDTLALEPQASLNVICGRITEAITTATDYPLVAVLTNAGDEFGGLELRGWTLKEEKPFAAVLNPHRSAATHIHIDNNGLQSGSRTAILSVEDAKVSDLERLFGCTPAVAKALKKQTLVRSLYVVNLVARNRLVGVLVAGFFADAAAISQQDKLLLDRLSEPVGVALDNRLLFEENRRVLAQLRHSNEKLKALDETKDEFISMASHQLRTPLTAIKGYLSMVLEGDAGALEPNQRKLLEQSFFSSQRMVYLISDLLNLSRLNTGKFIMELTKVQLADLVQSEVDQLAETARSREITLLYKKPVNFPKFMLDETKTHQVVMNLIDNAIYYTRAGGKITVTLTETPQAVEFTVKDNGIGVPRHLQHRLFSKFYRAENARQARPDGTGLGLFMAKKVVVAQGGAIIFESEEGKGSTFGFRFSKRGHLAKN
jgi:signal transduction histidine kinase